MNERTEVGEVCSVYALNVKDLAQEKNGTLNISLWLCGVSKKSGEALGEGKLRDLSVERGRVFVSETLVTFPLTSTVHGVCKLQKTPYNSSMLLYRRSLATCCASLQAWSRMLTMISVRLGALDTDPLPKAAQQRMDSKDIRTRPRIPGFKVGR